jgi:hypothetical protein
MTKSYIVFAVILIITNEFGVEARMHKHSHSYCNYEVVRKITSENKLLNEQKDFLSTNNNDLIKIITLNNCKAGQIFARHKTEKYSINCVPCPENHYRSETNHTCYHCPEGYYSKSGWSECKKAETNSSNIHTLCERGTIIGTNKFGFHRASCIECYKFGDKKYMPYKNNHDSCFTCPSGSIVEYGGTMCRECPIGYYEKENKCIKCEIGTYTDKTGMTQCNVCSNKNSITYLSTGGYNCDNSIFYNLTDTIKNNLINMDMILKPFVSVLHEGIAFVSNF